jgi:uncharacterized peroxidase-related enzyme
MSSAAASGSAARGPYISVPDGLPGMAGLVAFKPSSGGQLQALAQQLLRGPSPLSQGEREMIAAFVSSRNDCYFCAHLHTAVAAHLLGSDREAVCAVIDGVDTARVSEKMRALLRIAAKVRRSGKDVAPADVEQARAAGAGDEDIYDAVLVAAAFCMFNRYVDGLAAITPRDDAVYNRIGGLRADQGYVPE